MRMQPAPLHSDSFYSISWDFPLGVTVPKRVVRSRLGSSIHVPKRKFNSNSSAFRFGSESSKTNSGKTIRLFELEAEVPKRIVNSNFCFSIWEPKRIVELDFRFSFWSGSSKTNSEKSTSANDNWFWSGDGERMAQKYTDPPALLLPLSAA